MADDVEMTPIDPSELTPVTAAEPPKVNPLVKPGLKLPPKPTGITAKLKLPPKPGLAPGLKLPSKKPGMTIAAKPIIRKPGGALNLPKPITAIPKPVAVEAPKPAAAEAPKPAATASKPLETLKAVTQSLKGVTQAIPQQAILHKTGIIADASTSEAQKEAAKHKTARISLSDAMGVAPVKDEHAPMKTIRIKRPINIPGSTSKLLTPQPRAEDDAPTMATIPAVTPAPEPAAADTSVTQRKTLKISRTSAVRPASKFGLKKPASQATTIAKAPAEEAAPADGEVADIPDMPAVPPMPQPVQAVSDVPAWATTLSAIIQIAACVAVAALVWYLYKDAQLPTFCGGLGWNA